MSEIDKESQFGEFITEKSEKDKKYFLIEQPRVVGGKDCLRSNLLMAQLIKELRLMNANLQPKPDGRSYKTDSINGEQEWT